MTDNYIYPLSFTPQLRNYIWGGRNLERLYGSALPPDVTAESWEISGHPTVSTVIDNGPLLTEGTLVVEIQQTSDLTYRVYDWGRLDSDGKTRPLHVDKALEVINF